MGRLILANGQKHKIIEGGRAFLNSLEARLFVSNTTPTGTTQPAFPSDECDDTGYLADAPLVAPYPNVAVSSGTEADCVGITFTFVFDHSPGDFTVYGLFFTDPADSDVTVMSQRDDAPFAVVAAGQVYAVEVHFFFDTHP